MVYLNFYLWKIVTEEDIIFYKSIYIPDYNDPKIKDLYSENYYNLIKSLGNGTIYFENKFDNINDAVDKIIFYVNIRIKVSIKNV